MALARDLNPIATWSGHPLPSAVRPCAGKPCLTSPHRVQNSFGRGREDLRTDRSGVL